MLVAEVARRRIVYALAILLVLAVWISLPVLFVLLPIGIALTILLVLFARAFALTILFILLPIGISLAILLVLLT